jgi:hypothetical protein
VQTPAEQVGPLLLPLQSPLPPQAAQVPELHLFDLHSTLSLQETPLFFLAAQAPLFPGQ